MTLSRKELIELGERAAREAWVAQSGYDAPDFNDIVRNVFAALDQAGMVIVPREPTEAMIEEGEGAWSGATAYQYSGIEEAWDAMIEAALTDQQI